MNSRQQVCQPSVQASDSQPPTPSLAMLLSTMPEDTASMMEFILARLTASTPAVHTKTDLHMDRFISETLLHMGMPAHMQGYRFVRHAIMLAVHDPAMTNCLSRALYPRIAELYATTVSRVERSIRHAIAAAWDKTGAEGFNHALGRCAFDAGMRPTNREFVTQLAERIRLGAQR